MNHIMLLVQPVDSYIHQNWVNSNETNFLKKQVLARGGFLILAPTSLIISALETMIGLGIGLGSICTFGMYKEKVQDARYFIESSHALVAHPYGYIVKTINPQAIFCEAGKSMPNGLLSSCLYEPAKKNINNCLNSNYFLKRHIVSRLIFGLLGISLVITRIADAIIGIPTAGFSILTCGKFRSLNHIAYRGLVAPLIIHDFFFCTMGIINPWALAGKKKQSQ